ncbi:MAG: hypothetical protein JKY95_04075 [Planctomycetaceae bacterium]|nr:hypothetical protein [Planctomycetaceae bacterium]
MTAKIQEVKIKKTMTGRVKLHYPCPACKAKLNSSRHDIGKTDNCPECGTEFLLCPEIEELLEKIDTADHVERMRAKEDKDFASQKKKAKWRDRATDARTATEAAVDAHNAKTEEKNKRYYRTHIGGFVNGTLKLIGFLLVVIGGMSFWGTVIDPPYLTDRFKDDNAIGATANSIELIEQMIRGLGMVLAGAAFVAVAALRDIRHTISQNQDR